MSGAQLLVHLEATLLLAMREEGRSSTEYTRMMCSACCLAKILISYIFESR